MHDLISLARWTGIGFAVAGLALVGWQIVKLRRGEIMTAKDKLVWLLGLAIVPSFSLALAQGVAYEQMQRVEFCRSCHIMEPYAADLADAKSDTLASAHALNHRVDPARACYVCHSTYTLTGPLTDKLRGLHHVTAFYFGHSKEDIHVYEPFKNATCLHCHGGAKSFETHAAHLAVMDQIRSEEMSCLTCHSAPHPEAARKRQ